MCVPYTHVHKQSKRRTHVRTSAVRSARACVRALNPSHKSSPGCGACMAYQLAASSFMDGFRIYSPGLIAKRRRARSKYLSILSHTIQNRNHIRKSSQHTHTHTPDYALIALARTHQSCWPQLQTRMSTQFGASPSPPSRWKHCNFTLHHLLNIITNMRIYRRPRIQYGLSAGNNIIIIVDDCCSRSSSSSIIIRIARQDNNVRSATS